MLVADAYRIIKKLHNEGRIMLIRQSGYFYKGVRIDYIRDLGDGTYYILTVDKIAHWNIDGNDDSIKKGI